MINVLHVNHVLKHFAKSEHNLILKTKWNVLIHLGGGGFLGFFLCVLRSTIQMEYRILYHNVTSDKALELMKI